MGVGKANEERGKEGIWAYLHGCSVVVERLCVAHGGDSL
jgi:hypothetical protein